MGTLVAVFLVALLALLALPGIWAGHVLKKYNGERNDLPYNGEEFAQELVDKFHISAVKVQSADGAGDHYDPMSKAVRLSPNHYTTRSLSAMVVAAHEVGHALQDATGYKGMALRTRLAQFAQTTGKIGNATLILAPIAGAVSRSPTVGFIIFGLALAGYLVGVLVNLATLPVEFDASFNRALPILEKCNYLDKPDMKIARRILLACAFTYVAQSLMSLLQLHRLLRPGR